MELKSPQLMQHLASILGIGHPENEGLKWIVYRLRPISNHSDSWERTIVERCHGQSIPKVVETLYLEELRKGAGLADIGIWKSLFDLTVLAAVNKLADQGYIRLVRGGESWEDAMPAEAMKKRILEVVDAELPLTVESAKHLANVSARPESSNKFDPVPGGDIRVNGRWIEQAKPGTVATRSDPVEKPQV